MENDILMNENFKQTTVTLSSQVTLRKEYFGGIVFDRRNGNIIEIDKSCYVFLKSLKNKCVDVHEIHNIMIGQKIIEDKKSDFLQAIQNLLSLGIIEKNNNIPTLPVLYSNDNNDNTYAWLSAPETVHWAVTYDCHKSCHDCYVRRFHSIGSELNTDNSLMLIDAIADHGVFQLAIGGGEPFCRRDIFELVQYASLKGLAVHITTGRYDFNDQEIKKLSGSLASLRFGLEPEKLLSPESLFYKEIMKSINLCECFGIKTGVNIILTRSVIEKLDTILKKLVDIGINHITFLRYKPSASIKKWGKENPFTEQINNLYDYVSGVKEQYKTSDIRIDCALSFTYRHLPVAQAEYHGAKGCVAADRIIAISPDGGVYPCSQLIHPRLCSGNILENSLKELWDCSKILRKYRSFREKKVFKESWCGVCSAKNNCGGCRVFADDALGGDPGCPAPVLPSLREIGKSGRAVDLKEYLTMNKTITVGEYMKRYGVGQRRAIKELNSSRFAITESGYSGKKKIDQYYYCENDILREVQGAVGYTSGGYPFAQGEEIIEWLDCDNYGYPAWIRNR